MRTVTTRLLLTCAAIGVAGGLANIGNAYLFNLLATVAPMLLGIAAGVYYLPAVLALAALRRGGVGLLTSLIAGLVQAPFVPTGILSVSVFVIIGILIELPFLLAGYRYWRGWLFYVAALWVATVYGGFWFLAYDLVTGTIWLQLLLPLILAATLVATTWLARFLAERVSATGVLRGLRLDEDRRRSRRRAVEGSESGTTGAAAS